MKRRTFLQASAATILFSQLTACSKKSLPKIEIPTGSNYKMDYIRNGVGFFTERGGTIGWMASPDGIVVVDTQFPEQSKHLIEAIKRLNNGRIDALINTHHHGDHTAGNPVFEDLTETIIAHANSVKNQKASAAKRNNQADQLYPNTTFTDSKSIVVGKETVTLNYFGRAHTDGDAVIHFENANVVHLGDLVFNRRFPYIDMGAGASIENWVKVLDKTMSNFDDETRYMWGHARDGFDILGGKEEIKAFQNYLEKLLVFGEQSLKSGIPLEILKKETSVIPGAEEWQGKGIGRSLDAVYAEIGRE